MTDAKQKIDPKLLEMLVCPLTKTTLSDPRRNPDHAAGRGAYAGGLTTRRLVPVSSHFLFTTRTLDNRGVEPMLT